jgi:hypothetical protein
VHLTEKGGKTISHQQCCDVSVLLIYCFLENAGCRSAIIGRYTTALFFLVCALIGVVYCARNRTAIRERFGIAGGPPRSRQLRSL